MTGETRSLARQLIDAHYSHRLIGTVFSAGQLSNNGIGVPLGVGQKYGVWFVLIGRKTSSASIADYMFYTSGHGKLPSERSLVLTAAEEVDREYESTTRPIKIISTEDSVPSSDLGFPIVMADISTGELKKGANFNLGDAMDKFLLGSDGLSTSFPYPYHQDLDPFIRSLFLTRGLSIRPPLSRKFILEKLVEDAYQHSVGIRKDNVRRDFQDLLRDLVGSGVFRVRGKFITYLTDFTEYRRRFQRLYYSYVDRVSKRTIFDYEGEYLH